MAAKADDDSSEMVEFGGFLIVFSSVSFDFIRFHSISCRFLSISEGILGLAALMKPLRIAAAIALTPWTADNVLPLIPWLSKKEEKARCAHGKARNALFIGLQGFGAGIEQVKE